MDGPRSSAEVIRSKAGAQARLVGWIVRRNVVGGLVFLLLRDGSGYVQLSGRKGVTPDLSFQEMKSATRESAVSAEGVVSEDERAPGKREVQVSSFTIISRAETWPITKTAARSSSYLYDKRHLSIRGRKVIATMKIRAEVIGAAFDYFRQNGFVLVSAPTFVQAAVEGGSTLFGVDYYGKKVYLSQSAQFYEEAALPALQKVWIFQPAFRAEKSKTAKHLTEFWMIEAEQAFTEQSENMVLIEGLLSFIVERVLERRQDELKTLGRRLREVTPPLPRISYDEARTIARKGGAEFEWGDDLSSEAERVVSMSQESPFFITDYPLSARSFYHKTYHDRPDITKSADLIAPEGYPELATGGERIADFGELMERLKSQKISPESLTWYLELRKYGMPPHTGFGMGVERTTRWIAGLKHIRAVSLFPRTVTRVSP